MSFRTGDVGAFIKNINTKKKNAMDLKKRALLENYKRKKGKK